MGKTDFYAISGKFACDWLTPRFLKMEKYISIKRYMQIIQIRHNIDFSPQSAKAMGYFLLGVPKSCNIPPESS
ncbi:MULTISPECIES: hypothetical protein [unclassified Tolypothrix]|uniref:hypothetical protein n=1 Tax=unclassified Tolypothrix TaxID=2649714 RepID=UPI0005EAA969|nr:MULTISPECIES: hypothetical protein [unclassified Tolypothrix]EKE99237.1 hypothetical protein FDUTEX481_03430 [Tolypothrix sp. PCC 7601]MBE9084677.1 hypothetical protein [Tolypothrix sp. LEGE 11397]UYD28262.1 hypothetical protein HGR01_09630 [Tolypothrix sp. PCC 7712]UYD35862.1 hypothetical protein HG267_08955 [Tolypothrix sp. PCC 7601]